MDNMGLESTPQPQPQPYYDDKPRWWTDGVQDSWNKVRAQVLQDWETVVQGSQQLDRQLAEDALALGHGARVAYHRIENWGRDLESRLQQDWKQMQQAVGRKWEDVRDAVKLGWERAKGATKSRPRGFC